MAESIFIEIEEESFQHSRIKIYFEEVWLTLVLDHRHLCSLALASIITGA